MEQAPVETSIEFWKKQTLDRQLSVGNTRRWLELTIEGMIDDQPAMAVMLWNYVANIATFRVVVAASDQGKIIGQGGRTARALRTLLTNRGRKDGMHYALDIESVKPVEETTDAE